MVVAVLIVLAAWAAWRHNGSQRDGSQRDATSPQAPVTQDVTPGLEPVPEATLAPASLPPAAGEASPHLRLGNPSRATPDPAARDNFLIVKPHYALSYNDSKGTANWVSWQLRADDLGDAPRKPQFDPDDMLPAGFTRIVHRDYSNSGFDRGHLVPHSDRDATRDAAWSTFVMTNVIPQAPNVNQRAWATLENYSRSLVADGRHTLFTISGPWGTGGVGNRGRRETIADGRVTVPAMCWKVIVVVPTRLSDSADTIPAGARVIAVRMPNDESQVTLAWTPFRTTAAEIERETGLRFFTALKPEVAEALRRRLDTTSVAAPATPRYLREGPTPAPGGGGR